MKDLIAARHLTLVTTNLAEDVQNEGIGLCGADSDDEEKHAVTDPTNFHMHEIIRAQNYPVTLELKGAVGEC